MELPLDGLIELAYTLLVGGLGKQGLQVLTARTCAQIVESCIDEVFITALQDRWAVRATHVAWRAD